MPKKKRKILEAAGNGPGGPSGGGVPVLGAIGGGDTSYRLGRPRKNWRLTGGGPSMSADSAYASTDYSARVNRGYDQDKERETVMFDDQDLESEDVEAEDFVDVLLRTRKIPIHTGGNITPDPVKMLRLKEVSVSRIVGDTLASTLLTIPLADAGIGQFFLNNVSKNAEESLQRLSQGIGVSYPVMVDGVKGEDLNELDQIIQKIKTLDQTSRDFAREEIEDYFYFIKNYIITLAQTYDSLIVLAAGQMGPQAATPEEVITEPAVNIATGVTGYFLRLLPFERLVFMGSARLVNMISGLNDIERAVRENPENSQILNGIQEGSGDAVSMIFTDTTKSIPRLGAIYRELRESPPPAPETEEESKENIDDIEDTSSEASEEADQSDTQDSLEKAAVVSGAAARDNEDEYDYKKSQIPESEPCPCPINEISIYKGDYSTMSSDEKVLRLLIRETAEKILDEKKKRKSKKKKKEEEPLEIDGYVHLGYGSGNMPYRPHIAELPDDAQNLQMGYAVKYEPQMSYDDDGFFDSDEVALRAIIREIAENFGLADDPMNEEEDSIEDDVEELDEYSGAGAVAGYVGKLGDLPPVPGASTPRRSPAAAAGSAFGGARPALAESRLLKLAGIEDKK